MRKGLMILAVSVLLPFCTVVQADIGEIFTATEPPVAGTESDAKYPDGSPLGYGNPCEIYGMAIQTLGAGRIKFEIQTNFGDLTSRQTYDAAHPTWKWMDSYSSGWKMQNVAAGDLYIRVHTLGTDASTDRLFGLVLENRTGTSSDPWFTTLQAAGYTSSNNPYDTAKQKGELWQLTGSGSGFGTGTYEGYAGAMNNEYPLMSVAKDLPGLLSTGDPKDTGLNSNYYPTLLFW